LATALNKLYLTSVAFCASLLVGTVSARADSTSEEIALLKAQLRRLEAKVAEQGRQTQQTRVAVERVATVHPAFTKGPLPALASTCPPDKFCYKGITITPGGFFAFESVFRDHNVGADIGTPFQNIPFTNARNYHPQELRLTARQSRLSLLVEGNPEPNVHVSGYGEFDFLGAAQTANSNESNSYNPRIRHLYATVDDTDFGGFHILAGQTWSFATMFATGLQVRKENIPLTIDAQYVPGFIWARQPQFRVTKDFGPDFHAGFSLENPQTNDIAGNTPTNFVSNAAPPGGSLFNSLNNVSFNHVPDIVGKVAWDPMIFDRKVHIEVFGVGRDFYARYNNEDVETFTGFGGGSILFPIIPKSLDVQFSGTVGDGIGRYGTAQLQGATVSGTGQLKPLSEYTLLAGLTWHAFPQLDVYGYAGREELDRKILPTVNGVTYGYGNPIGTNFSGCFVEGGTCAAVARRVDQLTVGAWYDVYKGPYGQLRGGAQYSYTKKTAFSDAAGRTPTTDDNIVLTSLRYYPF
jgi:hypothetical protein